MMLAVRSRWSISSRVRPLVSWKKSQKTMALLNEQTVKTR